MDKKIVFITGVSRGIGLEIAKCFSNDGFFVIGTSRSEFNLHDTLSSDQCLHIPLDVTNRDQVLSCLAKLKELNTIPNVLINNAGITKDQLFLKMKNEDWDDVIESNLTRVFNMTKLFIKSMIKERAGSIINISSTAGIFGFPLRSPYASSKWAIIGFTQTAAMELGKFKIRVNAVLPGVIKGRRMQGVIKAKAKYIGASEKSVEKEFLSSASMNCWIEEDDIGKMCSFLISDDGNKVSWQSIAVDGNGLNTG